MCVGVDGVWVGGGGGGEGGGGLKPVLPTTLCFSNNTFRFHTRSKQNVSQVWPTRACTIDRFAVTVEFLMCCTILSDLLLYLFLTLLEVNTKKSLSAHHTRPNWARLHYRPVCVLVALSLELLNIIAFVLVFLSTLQRVNSDNISNTGQSGGFVSNLVGVGGVVVGDFARGRGYRISGPLLAHQRDSSKPGQTVVNL